jgi:hypothetical protein|nr:hypothetical protein [uncultured Lachnoclostridium sp.]DAU44838.1 MAG TPA: hypothetical protein [Caudoviricetes sp.]
MENVIGLFVIICFISVVVMTLMIPFNISSIANSLKDIRDLLEKESKGRGNQ